MHDGTFQSQHRPIYCTILLFIKTWQRRLGVYKCAGRKWTVQLNFIVVALILNSTWVDAVKETDKSWLYLLYIRKKTVAFLSVFSGIVIALQNKCEGMNEAQIYGSLSHFWAIHRQEMNTRTSPYSFCIMHIMESSTDISSNCLRIFVFLYLYLEFVIKKIWRNHRKSSLLPMLNLFNIFIFRIRSGSLF